MPESERVGQSGDLGQPALDPAAAGRLVRAIEDDSRFEAEEREAAQEAEVKPGGTPELRIPGYTIMARVAGGGGGTVYRVLREGGGSDRPLALKVLRLRLGAGPNAQRAWRELQLLESLRLAATPRLIDYGLHDGRLYLVTEFVDGVPPDRYCQEKGLDRRGRVELLARIADAAQSLHEHGVIHRDLKPANILVTPAGEPVILDLGLASLLAETPVESLRVEGQAEGTLPFMAPEQARGERGRISTRTDVYSLGAIGYLLLAGATPHELSESIHEAIGQVAEDPPRPARQIDPTLPRALAAVLGKTCEGLPERRYGSAGELAADLRRWLAGEPVHAGTPTVWARVARWVGRHPVAATAVACVLIAAGTVGGTSAAVWWLNQMPAGVVFDPETAQRARLVSVTGHTLHTWDTGVYHGILAADMAVHDPERGGQPLVIVGFTTDWNSPYAGLLCAFDPYHPEKPIWTSAERPPGPQPAPVQAGSFAVNMAVLADVFPGHPGPEIVLSEIHHTGSPTCIRVLDLAGRTMYEGWHNGGTGSIYWLASPGLIVCSASNNEPKLPRKDFIEGRNPYPQVVFAVKPVLGQEAGWVNPHMAAPGDAAAWYRCLLPLEETDRVTVRVRGPNRREYDKGAYFQVCVGLHEGAASTTWIVDRDGRTVEGTEEPSDAWKQFFKGRTPPRFYLGELPGTGGGAGTP